MKLYTKKELKVLVQNATSKEDLKLIANHVFENKDGYGHLYVKTQLACIEKLPTMEQ